MNLLNNFLLGGHMHSLHRTARNSKYLVFGGFESDIQIYEFQAILHEQ